MILLAVLLSALSSQARRLSVFFPGPDKANGAAVIVCPGGSYYWLSRKIEGTEVAKKLADAGFTAFVLHYRHAGRSEGHTSERQSHSDISYGVFCLKKIYIKEHPKFKEKK